MVTKANGGGRVAAKDRAHEYVKRQVLTGAFPGGELISEGEVAGALGMSRTPVREAFLRLEAEGLLRLYPQRGALVVPVSSEEARAVIEARLVLEQFAARKVIGRGAAVRASVFERLSAELQRQRDAADNADWEEFSDADRAFHDGFLLVEADPHTGDHMRRVADEPGVDVVVGRAGLAGGRKLEAQRPPHAEVVRH